MNARIVYCAVSCVLCSVVSGQWSSPMPVPYESTWCNYEFVVTSGDTVWALWTSGYLWRDSAVAYASWSLGDSWAEPDSVGCSDIANGVCAGVDGQGRIWFLRFDGLVPLRRDETDCIVASVRESTGWRNLPSVLSCQGAFGSPIGLRFAADRLGQPWLGITEHVHEGTNQYNSARFGRLQGDTCTWPGYVMKGDTEPNEREVSGPALAPRPDSGMWSACRVVEWGAGRPRVCVHQIDGDTAVLLHEFGDWLCAAAVDSTGRFWVAYLDTLNRLWSATVGTDSVVEHRLIAERLLRPHGVSICVDCEGWVWCAWVAEDSTMAVSWNRGGAWSEPERAADADAYYSHLVPDSRGVVYLFYGRFRGFNGVRRLSRPGVEEMSPHDASVSTPAATITRGALYLPASPRPRVSASLHDAAGRGLMLLRPGPNDVRHLTPGIYFVRDARRQAQAQAQAVSKVVTAR